MPSASAIAAGSGFGRRPPRPAAPTAAARRVVDVAPNAFHVAGGFGEILSAHLGAGVAICLFDPLIRRGGLAVLLLAEAGGGPGATSAIEEARSSRLIESMIAELAPEPAARGRIEAHVFGGAALPVPQVDPAAGARSGSFALRFLAKAGVSVRGSDIGGCFPRRVRFEPAAANLAMEFVSLRHAEDLAGRERAAAPHSAG